MFFRKKSKPEPRPKSATADLCSSDHVPDSAVASESASASESESAEIVIADLGGYLELTKGSTSGGQGGGLTLEPNRTWMTMSRLSARPGEEFILYTSAKLLKGSTNGHASNFFVGPIFFNQAEEVVGWWTIVTPTASVGESEALKVRGIAPPGTVNVGIGLCGAWSGDPDAVPDSIVEFEGARLARVW